MTKHKFGGLWTRKKLAILDEYLRSYLKALKNMPFKLHYADAFAGTGSHTPDDENVEYLIPIEEFKGSVLTALDIEPGFSEYHFNDSNPEHVKALEDIRRANPDKTIHIFQEDANTFIPKFCKSLKQNDRAVLLVDPYSTQFLWETLKYVADSKKIDMWLLFPISAILRMTPTDEARVKPEWKNKIDKLLGTDQWEAELYKPKELPPMDDLFGIEELVDISERINVDELVRWVKTRLEQQFPYVTDPAYLRNNGKLLFVFFFVVSNDSDKAKKLADNIAKHIIRKNL